MRKRTPGVRIAVAATLGALLAAPVRADVTIGLYADAAGTSCSLVGNAPGAFSAWVVVRPDAAGVTGVRFAAPIPSCLGATYVDEIVPPNMVALGNSQEGISIALQCTSSPVAVLRIDYFRASTDPCCPYPIVADPIVGFVETADCQFNSRPMAVVPSHFNADGSCACAGNSAPNPPMTPTPVDLSPAESVHALLAWEALDADNNLVDCDVYLGTDPSPPLVAAHVPQKFHDPGTLAELTTYYWRVVARDALGLETSGPVWRFTTRALNSPPYPPAAPQPVNATPNVAPDTDLTWLASDVDGDTVLCDVYFGASSPPPLVATDFAGLDGWFTYDPGLLEFGTTYYWRVVTRDPGDHETSGPTWWFSTRPANQPPAVPSTPSPAHGAVNQPVSALLSWWCSDPEGDAITYDVYFGTTPDPALKATGVTQKLYPPGSLAYATVYYWRIVARDAYGGESSGPTWYFTTRPVNLPPDVPSNPVPANNTTNRLVSQALSWTCADGDGDNITYDVYFGTDASPPWVAGNVAMTTFAPALDFATQYHWFIVARDEHGAETPGPTWTFTTTVNDPPAAPSNPNPPNNTTGRSVIQALEWQCTEPDGQAMTFDVYFGTSDPPPLVSPDLPNKIFNPGTLAFLTKYYWRIVARDATDIETSGPTWNFTTRANTPPTVPGNPFPPNASGISDLSPTFTWTCADLDLQPLTYDVYFGTELPPPLAATGLTERSFAPGTLALGATYYWRVVASDGITTTGGPTWSFLVALPGDVNLDGVFDTADAACAFHIFLENGGCGGPGSNYIANVNCATGVTPGDARCLHKQALDGSCAFCGAGAAVVETLGPGQPTVVVQDTWIEGDTLCARLAVGGVSSFTAFGFTVYDDLQTQLVGVEALGLTAGFEVLGFGDASPSRVGGYTLGQQSVSSYQPFMELRFVRNDGGSTTYIQLGPFLDDLAAAPSIAFYIGNGNPVLVSEFDAVAREGAVAVSWVLEADEAMERFRLMRREGKATGTIEVASGPVAGARDMFVDTRVEAGKTYHYQLLVHTADGDVFRSPEAAVTLPAAGLVLHQNHPNPFNPQTTIRYELPMGAGSARVRLWILDPAGRIVRTLVNDREPGGLHEVVWDGRDDGGNGVSSGVYFYVLDAGGDRVTRKLVLLK